MWKGAGDGGRSFVLQIFPNGCHLLGRVQEDVGLLKLANSVGAEICWCRLDLGKDLPQGDPGMGQVPLILRIYG